MSLISLRAHLNTREAAVSTLCPARSPKAPSAPSSFPQSPLQSYVRLRRSPGNRRTPDGPDAEKPSLCRRCLPDSIDQAAIAWNATQPQSPGHTRASWACPTFHKVNGLLNSSAKWQQLKSASDNHAHPSNSSVVRNLVHLCVTMPPFAPSFG